VGVPGVLLWRVGGAVRRLGRVPRTGVTRVLGDAFRQRPPPGTSRGRRVSFKYATRASAEPPTFVIFVNDESLLTQAYRRYLQNRLRDRFGFSGNPIQVLARSSAGRD